MSIQDNFCCQHTPCVLCARNDRGYTTGECPDSTRQAVQSALREQATSLIVKEFGVSAQWLNRYLWVRRVQYPCSGTWVLYQLYADKGYTQTKTILYGSKNCKLVTYWTQKGRAFLYEFLREDGILPLSERPHVPMDMESFCYNRCRPFPCPPASSL